MRKNAGVGPNLAHCLGVGAATNLDDRTSLLRLIEGSFMTDRLVLNNGITMPALGFSPESVAGHGKVGRRATNVQHQLERPTVPVAITCRRRSELCSGPGALRSAAREQFGDAGGGARRLHRRPEWTVSVAGAPTKRWGRRAS